LDWGREVGEEAGGQYGEDEDSFHNSQNSIRVGFPRIAEIITVRTHYYTGKPAERQPVTAQRLAVVCDYVL